MDKKKLIEQRNKLKAQAKALLDTIDQEEREFTDEEQAQYDETLKAIAANQKKLDNLKAMEAVDAYDDQLEQSTGRRAPGNTPRSEPASSRQRGAEQDRDGYDIGEGAEMSGGHERMDDQRQFGFQSAGEFASAVRRAVRGNVDDRLRIVAAAPSAYGNEDSGADGGYLVPPAFSSRIYGYSLEQDALLPLTDQNPIAGNAMSFPADETTPWGTNGIRGYWEAEAAQATPTKPVLKRRELRLRKLFALVPVTDELLEDATALENYISRKTGESIRFKVNDAIIAGNGVGMPLGFANGSALVTQAKETSQTAATINAANVAKMFGRCLQASRATWIANHDAYNQFPLMVIGQQPVFTPPTEGMKQFPMGNLFGRPITLQQSCSTLGTAGDLYLADLSQYVTITKQGGMRTETSMHLWFDYDITAFRVTFRIDGQPAVNAAASPKNGSVTLSPFVQLATRS